MSAQPWVLWMCDRLIREVPMDIGPLRNVIEIRTSIAELIAADVAYNEARSQLHASDMGDLGAPDRARMRFEAAELRRTAALAAVTKEPSYG